MKTAVLRWGVLIFIVWGSLYASVQNLLSTRDLGSIQDDPVADWEARFAPLKQRLPFERGEVGYISDSSVPGVSYNAPNDEGEYILTQYAMAPIIIVKGDNEEWTVANLSSAAYKAWSASHEGQFDVIWSRDGIYLLHRIGG